MIILSRYCYCQEEAAKRAASSGKGPPREDIESGLKFEGFVAFVCKVSADHTVLVLVLVLVQVLVLIVLVLVLVVEAVVVEAVVVEAVVVVQGKR